jgi:four helix bundle protein
MKSDNLIQQKTYEFALEMIKLAHRLKGATHYEISSQMLRSGTSIGANVEEAIGGQSRKDFCSKLSIAYKEARESHYWLRLIRDSNLYEEEEVNRRLFECEEI